MRNSSTPNPSSNVEEPNQRFMFLVPLGLSTLVLALAYFGYKKYFKKQKEYSPEDFQFALSNLKLQYPAQNYETWLQISIIVSPLMEIQEPRRPGVLLVIRSRKYQLSYLEHELATVINSAVLSEREPMVLNEDFLNDNRKSVTQVYEQFQVHFSKGGQVVIVQNIDKITSPDVLNLFHSMCDNDYAQHKRVCFIFTASLPQSTGLGYYQQSPENIRNAIFSERWAHIPVDKRRALVARIGATTTLWL